MLCLRKLPHPVRMKMKLTGCGSPLLQDALLAPQEPLPEAQHWARYRLLKSGWHDARIHPLQTKVLSRNDERRI